MKELIKKVTFVSLFLSSFVVVSQGGAPIPIPSMGGIFSEEIYQSVGNSGGGTWVRTKGGSVNQITGSKYLFDVNNLNASIFFKNKNKIDLNSLNYNIENKTLEAAISRDSVFVINTDNIDYINKDNKKYYFYDNQLVGVVYSDDKIKILKSFSVKIKDDINPLSKEYSGSSYVKSSNYNFVVDGKLKPMKLNKKNIFNLLKDKEIKVKEYAETNKLDLTEEYDVVRIINYYNSI